MKLNIEIAIIFWHHVVKILELKVFMKLNIESTITVLAFELQILAVRLYEIDPRTLILAILGFILSNCPFFQITIFSTSLQSKIIYTTGPLQVKLIWIILVKLIAYFDK